MLFLLELTDFMKQYPWEANSRSASQGTPCLQEPTTGPYPEADESSPQLPTLLPYIYN